MRIATYLKFNGKCEEALNKYKELFDAKVTCKIKYSEGMTENIELIGKIFHAELKIKEFYIFMSDEAEKLHYENQAYKVTVECDSLEDAQRYFNTLSADGTVIHPFTHMEWGDYIGTLRDTYGITWDFIFCGQ